MNITEVLRGMLNDATSELSRSTAELATFDGVNAVQRAVLVRAIEDAQSQVNALQSAVTQAGG